MKKPPVRRPAEPGPDEPSGRSVQVQAEWSGPLPPPAILGGFNDVVENGAERIFAAWEKETAHRHKIESRDVMAVAIDAILGKILAFIFVAMALALCGYAIAMGSEVVATILGGGVIASVVWAFVKVNRPGK